jgi:hypothetical protein
MGFQNFATTASKAACREAASGSASRREMSSSSMLILIEVGFIREMVPKTPRTASPFWTVLVEDFSNFFQNWGRLAQMSLP